MAVSKLSEVESRTQGSRPKKQKKSKAKDQLFEDSFSRPRTGMLEAKNAATSVLQTNGLQKVFQAISDSLAYPGFLIGGSLNHKL